MLKKRFLLASKIVGIVIIVLISSYFIFRGQIFNYFLSKAQEKFHQKYNCQLGYKEAKMKGLIGFSFTDLYLVPTAQDTLLQVKVLEGELGFWSLLKGDIKFKNIRLEHGYLNAIRTGGKDNFSFLFNEKSKSKEVSTETDYGKIAHKLISLIFSKVPDDVNVVDFRTSYSDKFAVAKFDIQSLSYKDKKLKAEVLAGDNKKRIIWITDATIDKRSELFEGKIYAKESSIKFPYVDQRFKLNVGFDTAYFSLNENEYEDDVLLLKGKMKSDNFYLKHPRIDSNQIVIKEVGADYIIKIGKRFADFEMPSMNVNRITMDLKAAFHNEASKKYLLKANMKKMKAQDFFTSLPGGLFASFEGINVSGNLEYHLDFALDEARPDSVKFDSRFIDDQFKVNKYGAVNFSKMNGSFTYTAYERDRAVRSFVVGTDNPVFTPIDQISPYLKSAVLQSEDGSFYWHNGFREDAFRMAIAANVKEGRFARGGSTISMQLVKNVFLSRKKTVARKLEEALIVWMIEKKRLTSKDRMYEVYLNIIEWGPNVYGVREASHFYFGKTPSELSIEESIFMASIIPRPKSFKYSFDERGNLRSYLESYFRKLGELLMRREVITEEQRLAIVPNVKLNGPARMFVIKDTVAADSSDVEDDLFEIE